MARKARKTSKTKKPKRKAPARAKARGKMPARRAKPAVPRAKKAAKPTKVGSAFQIMIDTINETERLRDKRELRSSDETQ